ncbi:MAG: S8 family serine peptidase, partial [Candidatus Thermoplasmatota archaeon]|nr:S8 family serine peptidase [Candidatus Thermoplasmatota archaeon]
MEKYIMNTPRRRLRKAFFPLLISTLLVASVFSSGIVLAEENEDKIEILIHKQGLDFEKLSVRQEFSVIEEYHEFALVETTEEKKLTLMREGHIIETLENKYHVGLRSYSFNTDEGTPKIPENLKIEKYAGQEEGTYIIQFIGPIKTEWKEELKDMGVSFHEFRHRYNYIVKMDPSIERDVEDLNFVNWVGIYQPAYKFDPGLLKRSDPVNIEISIFDGSRPESLEGKELGLSESQFIPEKGRITGQVESGGIKRLANQPHVLSITEETEEYQLYNSDATWVTETDQQNYRKMTEDGITGNGELITVMDSQLYMEDDWIGEGVHEAWEDPDGNSVGDDHRKVQAWYVPGDSSAKLEYGVYHGTHVTGTVLGNSPSYGEYSNNDGNALEGRLIFQDIDNEVYGLNLPSDMYNMGWGDAYDRDSRVHTNSWGGGDGYGGLGLEADEFLWDHKDFNILFAMANSGPDPNTLSQQAEGKNVISVGSVKNYPYQESVSSFSSRGYADDGRIKPTVMHVGENVVSANRSYDGYQSLSGTSMATPGIAGQVGQIRQYFGEGWHIGGIPNEGEGFQPSNALVRATLINGAVEITGEGAYHSDEMFPNKDQGYGRSKLDRVLHLEGDERELEVFDSLDENVTLDTGESWSMNFEVDDPSQELEVALAWTDHPGSSGSNESNPAIVNDLDLELNTPNGTRYVGNAFTGYNPGYSKGNPTSNPWNGQRDGEFDGLNVEENILLIPDQNGVEGGTYELTVSGHNVPEDTQPFAIVISGGLGSSETSKSPSIELTNPKEGETWYSGGKEDITWETERGDGSLEDVDLEYSSDGGASWSSIAQGVEDDGVYTWTVPEISSSEAKIRATVYDSNDLSDENVSGLFTIEEKSSPLKPTNPEPKDGATGINADVKLSIYVEHEDGEDMDVYFYDASDDSLIGKDEGIPSGSRSSVDWIGLDHGTIYEWYAEADDGKSSNVSGVWQFTTIEEHILTIETIGQGSIDPSEGSHNYTHGEEVNLTAVPDQGYEFDGWTGDYTGSEDNITITMDSDKEITAQFEIKTYELTVNTVGEGSVDVEPEKMEYEHGEEVNLTAVPDQGYEFDGWTGDYTGSEDNITITMDSDKEITAQFE